ncbi:MAG: hypothetical protein IKW97_08330 [Muribaculaceae bacterium]|nr:hypothetical protein [Muribaculaceae bacterium]
MYLYWPFDVFSDIFSTFGVIVGGIIALVLALLIITFYAVLAIIAVMFIAWVVGLIWQMVCRFMVWILPIGKESHRWFKKQIKYQQ